jgi:hypothetical protein
VSKERLGDPQVGLAGDLEVFGKRLDDRHHPAGVLDEGGVVGRGRERRGIAFERSPEHVRAEDLRGLNRPQGRAVERAKHAPVGRGLLDGVGHGHGGDRAVDARLESREAALDELTRDQRPRGVVDDGHLRLLRRRQRVLDRGRARVAPAHEVRLLVPALGRRHDDAVAHGAQRIEAPLDQRTAGTNDERLGPVGTKAFAAAAGRNDADDTHSRDPYAVAGAPFRLACASAISSSR